MIAGGGTAGHVLPGVAVANELVRRGHERDGIHFVGAARGPEADLVPAAGYGVTLLPGRGLQRRLSLANLAAALGLLRAALVSIRLLWRMRPSVVLVLGGYAAASCALAAVLLRIPMVVADQNARAGAVNRLAARFARACAVPFADTDLPRAVVTGNPVREQVLDRAANPDPDGARRELGIPQDRAGIAVFAGSLGAQRINAATAEAVRGAWGDRSDLAVHHVVGARDWDAPGRAGGVAFAETATDGAAGVLYQPVRYEDRMDLVLDAADLVVCRAGGTTVAELAVMGVPSILVPLPIATRDHQRANAAELVEAGAAVLVGDDELDAGRLVAEVEAVSVEADGLQAMAAAAAACGRPDAAGAVADLLEQHGG